MYHRKWRSARRTDEVSDVEFTDRTFSFLYTWLYTMRIIVFLTWVGLITVCLRRKVSDESLRSIQLLPGTRVVRWLTASPIHPRLGGERSIKGRNMRLRRNVKGRGHWAEKRTSGWEGTSKEWNIRPKKEHRIIEYGWETSTLLGTMEHYFYTL